MDNYTKQLKDFLKMMQGRLYHAWDQMDEGNDEPMDDLYNQRFIISFMGKNCYLDFGPDEFQALETMLQNIIEDLQ